MATQPSLAMIPAGYKATKLYSQLPVDGVGDFTVDRNSAATRVNADGLIEEVGLNVPRLDYLNGSCPELLVEPQSTNLITYSEDFSDGSWVKSNITINSDLALSPDGSVNADELVVTSSSLGNVYSNIVVADDSNTYVGSFYIKKSSTDKFTYAYLRFLGGATSIIYGINFNQRNGDFLDIDDTTFSGSTAPSSIIQVEDFSDNYWKVYFGGANNSTGNTSLRLYFNPQRGTSLGDFTLVDGSAVIWGAQLEQLEYPTSYIKTEGATGAAATRLADDLNGAGDSNIFNDSEGVLFVEALSLTDTPDSDRIVRIENSSDPNNEYIAFTFDTTTNRVQNVVRTGGVNQYTSGYITPDTTIMNKFAFKYKENDFALWFNGSEVRTGSSGSTPSGLDELYLSVGFGGRFKQILYFNSALSDSELQSLTS